jgi:hypothetical protein
MENFVRKLKRGTDKYKGMLPFEFFNCCGIGYFSSKFPYDNNKYSDEEEDPKKKNKNKKGDKRRKKKSSRKLSTQRKIVPYQMRMMIVTVIQKEFSSWKHKMMKKILKNKVKSIS